MVIDGFAIEEMHHLMNLLIGFSLSCCLVQMLRERPYVGNVLMESVAVYSCTVLMSVLLFDSLILIFRKRNKCGFCLVLLHQEILFTFTLLDCWICIDFLYPLLDDHYGLSRCGLMFLSIADSPGIAK